MGTPYMAEIKLISFGFAPKGWALCNGQLLPINQNQALFSILGTTYGGDGRVNFALPDLRSRTPFHTGNGFTLGQVGGAEAHTLTMSQMPTHNHLPIGSSITASQASPANGFWANAGINIYSTNAPTVDLAPESVGFIGGSQPHENRSPYLVLNFVIALQGIFPSRN